MSKDTHLVFSISLFIFLYRSVPATLVVKSDGSLCVSSDVFQSQTSPVQLVMVKDGDGQAKMYMVTSCKDSFQSAYLVNPVDGQGWDFGSNAIRPLRNKPSDTPKFYLPLKAKVTDTEQIIKEVPQISDVISDSSNSTVSVIKSVSIQGTVTTSVVSVLPAGPPVVISKTAKPAAPLVISCIEEADDQPIMIPKKTKRTASPGLSLRATADDLPTMLPKKAKPAAFPGLSLGGKPAAFPGLSLGGKPAAYTVMKSTAATPGTSPYIISTRETAAAPPSIVSTRASQTASTAMVSTRTSPTATPAMVSTRASPTASPAVVSMRVVPGFPPYSISTRASPTASPAMVSTRASPTASPAMISMRVGPTYPPYMISTRASPTASPAMVSMRVGPAYPPYMISTRASPTASPAFVSTVGAPSASPVMISTGPPVAPPDMLSTKSVPADASALVSSPVIVPTREAKAAPPVMISTPAAISTSDVVLKTLLATKPTVYSSSKGTIASPVIQGPLFVMPNANPNSNTTGQPGESRSDNVAQPSASTVLPGKPVMVYLINGTPYIFTNKVDGGLHLKRLPISETASVNMSASVCGATAVTSPSTQSKFDNMNQNTRTQTHVQAMSSTTFPHTPAVTQVTYSNGHTMAVKQTPHTTSLTREIFNSAPKTNSILTPTPAVTLVTYSSSGHTMVEKQTSRTLSMTPAVFNSLRKTNSILTPSVFANTHKRTTNTVLNSIKPDTTTMLHLNCQSVLKNSTAKTPSTINSSLTTHKNYVSHHDKFAVTSSHSASQIKMVTAIPPQMETDGTSQYSVLAEKIVQPPITNETTSSVNHSFSTSTNKVLDSSKLDTTTMLHSYCQSVLKSSITKTPSTSNSSLRTNNKYAAHHRKYVDTSGHSASQIKMVTTFPPQKETDGPSQDTILAGKNVQPHITNTSTSIINGSVSTSTDEEVRPMLLFPHDIARRLKPSAIQQEPNDKIKSKLATLVKFSISPASTANSLVHSAESNNFDKAAAPLSKDLHNNLYFFENNKEAIIQRNPSKVQTLSTDLESSANNISCKATRMTVPHDMMNNYSITLSDSSTFVSAVNIATSSIEQHINSSNVGKVSRDFQQFLSNNAEISSHQKSKIMESPNALPKTIFDVMAPETKNETSYLYNTVNAPGVNVSKTNTINDNDQQREIKITSVFSLCPDQQDNSDEHMSDVEIIDNPVSSNQVNKETQAYTAYSKMVEECNNKPCRVVLLKLKMEKDKPYTIKECQKYSCTKHCRKMVTNTFFDVGNRMKGGLTKHNFNPSVHFPKNTKYLNTTGKYIRPNTAFNELTELVSSNPKQVIKTISYSSGKIVEETFPLFNKGKRLHLGAASLPDSSKVASLSKNVTSSSGISKDCLTKNEAADNRYNVTQPNTLSTKDASSHDKGTKSTSFLTHVRNEVDLAPLVCDVAKDKTNVTQTNKLSTKDVTNETPSSTRFYLCNVQNKRYLVQIPSHHNLFPQLCASNAKTTSTITFLRPASAPPTTKLSTRTPDSFTTVPSVCDTSNDMFKTLAANTNPPSVPFMKIGIDNTMSYESTMSPARAIDNTIPRESTTSPARAIDNTVAYESNMIIARAIANAISHESTTSSAKEIDTTTSHESTTSSATAIDNIILDKSTTSLPISESNDSDICSLTIKSEPIANDDNEEMKTCPEHIQVKSEPLSPSYNDRKGNAPNACAASVAHNSRKRKIIDDPITNVQSVHVETDKEKQNSDMSGKQNRDTSEKQNSDTSESQRVTKQSLDQNKNERIRKLKELLIKKQKDVEEVRKRLLTLTQ